MKPRINYGDFAKMEKMELATHDARMDATYLTSLTVLIFVGVGVGVYLTANPILAIIIGLVGLLGVYETVKAWRRYVRAREAEKTFKDNI